MEDKKTPYEIALERLEKSPLDKFFALKLPKENEDENKSNIS